MRALRGGSPFLALGGILLVLGSFLPEVAAFSSGLLHPGTPGPAIGKSHWIVFSNKLDMLRKPVPENPWWYSLNYAASALGLFYFAAAGILFALSSLSRRSRSLAFLIYLAHAAALWALAMATLVLAVTFMSEETEIGGDRQIPTYLGAAGLLWTLLLAEVCSPALAGRRLLRLRLSIVDAVNLLPAVFFFILNAALAALLLGHPNWPGGGYPVGAAGALLCLGGIFLRSRESRGDVKT